MSSRGHGGEVWTRTVGGADSAAEWVEAHGPDNSAGGIDENLERPARAEVGRVPVGEVDVGPVRVRG